MENLETKSAKDLIAIASDETLKSLHKDAKDFINEFPNGSNYAPILITMIENEMEIRVEMNYPKEVANQ